MNTEEQLSLTTNYGEILDFWKEKVLRDNPGYKFGSWNNQVDAPEGVLKLVLLKQGSSTKAYDEWLKDASK